MKTLLKSFVIASAVFMLGASFVSCSKKADEKKAAASYKVAMITDSGDITDESFNQTTYEAGKAFCEANGLQYKYYKPAGDSDSDRIAAAEQAIAEGANLLLCPGFLFGGTVVEISATYPDVKIVALDLSAGDILSAAVSDYTWDPSQYNVKEHYHSENVYCAIYKEELSGYLAGYAAVKMGFRHLGFLGGMAVPAVVRYGYGYVQGINDAAKEINVAKDIVVEYVYGNQFYGDADITAYMDTWAAKKVEVVFACGGGIWTSAAEVAKKNGNMKLIGVDVDQKNTIDSYGAGMTVTSAMKGLAATVKSVLTETILKNNWAAFSGKIETLGLVSENPVENYVALAPSTVWTDSFKEADYLSLVKKMYSGEIKVSNDIAKEPAADVKVNYYGNIK